MTMQVTSPAFQEGDTIPKTYTCDGQNISPALEWTGLPNGTKSLALIADDPDAPSGDWVHWVIFNIPATAKGLPEGVATTGTVEGLGMQGTNDFRKTGYGGPCPPKGPAHRYYFRLYALDATIDLKSSATKKDLEKAMQGHILGQGQHMGRYGR